MFRRVWHLIDNYNEDLEKQIQNNPKAFWTFLKSKKNNTNSCPAAMSNGVKTSTSGVEICNMFSSHFASVYDVIALVNWILHLIYDTLNT